MKLRVLRAVETELDAARVRFEPRGDVLLVDMYAVYQDGEAIGLVFAEQVSQYRDLIREEKSDE